MTPADTCRARGWTVGTVLAGDEGYGVTVIRITAIGERAVLCRTLSHRGEPYEYVEEHTWTFDCRDWQITDMTPPVPSLAGLVEGDQQ